MNALHQDLLNQNINNVKIIAIGKGQYSSNNSNWTDDNTIPVVNDPSPNNTWTNWDANQRDLFFLDNNGNYVDNFNITAWDYDKIYNTILGLLSGCTDPEACNYDESANVEIRKWGEIPNFDFDVKGHEEIAVKLDLLDIQRASKIAGARFYFLKGDLVRLAHAVTSFAFDFLSEKGYKLIQPPYMINRKSMEGAVIADDMEDVIYGVIPSSEQKEELFLIGTSEHAIASMYSDEILDGKSLPDRFGSISPCFRKEAGAHGKDQKGIFRVHQFEKFEQFVFAKPEESEREQEKMIEYAEEFYQKLGIPHRVVLLSSADMGKVAAKTYDIEAWMPGQNAYREICSVSNCFDFQSRRLMIRFRDKTNEETQYVHTLNGTLVAIERTLVAIIENYQTNDGHVIVPEVLQKYLGIDKI